MEAHSMFVGGHVVFEASKSAHSSKNMQEDGSWPSRLAVAE